MNNPVFFDIIYLLVGLEMVSIKLAKETVDELLKTKWLLMFIENMGIIVIVCISRKNIWIGKYFWNLFIQSTSYTLLLIEVERESRRV